VDKFEWLWQQNLTELELMLDSFVNARKKHFYIRTVSLFEAIANIICQLQQHLTSSLFDNFLLTKNYKHKHCWLSKTFV